jgi:amidase
MDWLLQASIGDLQEAYRGGRITVAAVTRFYLDRIAAFPALNAVRAVSPLALETAEALDRHLAAGSDLPALFGVPLLVKDNIFLADGTPCAAGAAALAGLIPSYDTTLVVRLKRAGAVILGKANMTEFADYVSETMPSEFSGLGGVVRHPRGLGYGRGGGSSVGPAAAVAAGLAQAAIGSETQNSIQAPAASSGVVGLKPTVGLVSRHGMIPLVPSQDTAGVLARSVGDAAVILDAMRGADPNDTATLPSAFVLPPRTGRPRLGLPRNGFFGRPGQEAIEAALASLLRQAAEQHYAEIVDPAEIGTAAEVADLRSSVFRTEFKAALNALLARHASPGVPASLADIITWNRAHPEAIPYGQGLLEAAEATSGDLADPAYVVDRKRDLLLCRHAGLDATLAAHDLDALVVPMANAAKLTGKAGHPVVTLPLHYDDAAAPAAFSLIGHRFGEARLLTIAAALARLGPSWSVATHFSRGASSP